MPSTNEEMRTLVQQLIEYEIKAGVIAIESQDIASENHLPHFNLIKEEPRIELKNLNDKTLAIIRYLNYMSRILKLSTLGYCIHCRLDQAPRNRGILRMYGVNEYSGIR